MLRSIKSPSKPIDFHFRMSSSGNRLTEIIPFLPQIPEIKQFTLIECLEGVDELFDALLSVNAESGERLCPNPEEIALYQTPCYTPGKLFGVVQGRARAGLRPSLSRLVVCAGSAMNPETYAAIKEIMGDGVSWDKAK